MTLTPDLSSAVSAHTFPTKKGHTIYGSRTTIHGVRTGPHQYDAQRGAYHTPCFRRNSIGFRANYRPKSDFSSYSEVAASDLYRPL
jgi:hypothetical protein